ncbi:MAG: ABC transporter permease, partial [Bacteroidales bacterium]|nr:ABC transporter permease [Bacteroidales bacterium]
MNFPLFVATRYIKSKNTHNIINIISWISAIGIAVTTAALIVVLSVFNGFEELITTMYTSFDPDLKISANKGKSFSTANIDSDAIISLPCVENVQEVVEDNALLKHDQQQIVATIKGVNSNYFNYEPLAYRIVLGDTESLKAGNCIAGYGIGYYLNLQMNNLPQPINILVPKRNNSNLLNLLNAFNSKTLPVAGIFSIQQELDDKYLFIPLSEARKLLNYDNDNVTALEIRLKPNADLKQAQKKIKEIAGEDFIVKNHFELQDTLYKVMHSEKAAVFLILCFLILISAFNIIGSLSMLVISKEKDIAILHSMGCRLKTIKRIFINESLLLTLSGAIIGLIIGSILCILQMTFGIIKLGTSGSFIIDSYPVQ